MVKETMKERVEKGESVWELGGRSKEMPKENNRSIAQEMTLLSAHKGDWR